MEAVQLLSFDRGLGEESGIAMAWPFWALPMTHSSGKLDG
jgi:hypothetical protein